MFDRNQYESQTSLKCDFKLIQPLSHMNCRSVQPTWRKKYATHAAKQLHYLFYSSTEKYLHHFLTSFWFIYSVESKDWLQTSCNASVTSLKQKHKNYSSVAREEGFCLKYTGGTILRYWFIFKRYIEIPSWLHRASMISNTLLSM